MIHLLAAVLLAFPLLAQLPNRFYAYTSPFTGHTVLTEIYRPVTPGWAHVNSQADPNGLYATPAFGGAASVWLEPQAWCVTALGGFEFGATEFFVANPIFFLIAPGDYSVQSPVWRVTAPGIPGDVVGATDLLVGLLPLGADLTMQTVFLNGAGPVFSEAVRTIIL
jgi:hypothetical protein